MTLEDFERAFREEVLPLIRANNETLTGPDYPLRREVWNDMIDAYVEDGSLSLDAIDASLPDDLDTPIA